MAKKKAAKRPAKTTDVSGVEVKATCSHPFAPARALGVRDWETVALDTPLARPNSEMADAVVAAANEVKEAAIMFQEILAKVKRFLP